MKFQKIAALLVSIFLSLPLYAQTAATGAITGTVTDSSGARIPGATVTATNAETGQLRTVTTGADGVYQIPLLQPGAYNIKFSASGFKTTEVPRVNVQVTETPVLDQKLDLGTQAEEVTVAANVETIQTATSALGTVVTGNEVSSLPLTMRNYTNVMGLSAGVSANVTNAAQLGKAGMDFSVNGASISSNNFQIDGMNVNAFSGSNGNSDGWGATSSKPVPSPDALQEFKVQTATYDAGYGRNAGANVNAVTKSGTNTFHGTVFEYFRNTKLDANNFFLNLQGKPIGVFNQNQWGGVIGGPIKKDKLFFFFSYQDTGQKNGQAAQAIDSLTLPPIPTGDRSAANFQQLLGAQFCPTNHTGSTQYNTSRGGVQVACDGSNINPTAVALLRGRFPSTTPAVGGQYIFPGSSNGAFQNANVQIPALYHEKQELANGDYILSSKHTLSLRFFNTRASASVPFIGGSVVPGFGNNDLLTNITGNLKVTSVLSSSLVNEFRMSTHLDAGLNPNNYSGLSDHQFGITPISPYQDWGNGIPSAIIPGFMSSFNIAGAYNVGNSTSDDSITRTASIQLADQISWTHGKHTIRTGFEFEQLRWSWALNSLGRGQLTIGSFADFLLGLPGCAPSNTACSATNPGNTNGTAFSNVFNTNLADAFGPAANPRGYYMWNNSAFVTDDWKVSSKLTLNLGVRYDYQSGLGERFGKETAVWPSAVLKVPVPGSTPATGTLAGWVVPANYQAVGGGTALLPGLTQSSGDFAVTGGPGTWPLAPRFGFAYQPFGGSKFVIRGGFGIFFDRIASGTWNAGMQNTPPVAPPADASGAANYYSTLAVPFQPLQAGTFAPRWVNFANLTSSNITLLTYGPNFHTPSLQNYNLQLQYNFYSDYVLEVGYVGSHGIHQMTISNGQYDENQAVLADAASPVNGITTNTVANGPLRVPLLGFGVISDNGAPIFSNRYNSLQVTLRKQLSHGFLYQVAYTYSRSFTNTGFPNAADFAQQWGPTSVGGYSAPVHPHRVVISYSWNVPNGGMKGFLGAVTGGWNLSGVTTIENGTPLTVTDATGAAAYYEEAAGSTAQIAPGKTYSQVPTPGGIEARLGGLTGGCGYFVGYKTSGSLNGTSCSSLSSFIPVPLATAPDGTVAGAGATGFGNTGYGFILGPGQFNFDAALIKNTRVGGIHENGSLQFRAEFYNLMNHAQFNNPSTVVSSGNFGQITSLAVNPRMIQLALKYIF